MPSGRINPSGCEIRKDRIKLRLDFFLYPTEPNYDKRHLFVVDWDSPEAQAGYPGAVDELGEPIDCAAYQAWEDSLPRVWVDTPLHTHFIHPDHTASDDDIRSEISRCLSYFYAFHQHCWDSKLAFIGEWKKVSLREGEVRCRFTPGSSKDKKKNESRLQDILDRPHDFDIDITAAAVGRPDLRIGEHGTIDVGTPAADFNSWSETNNYTQVEGANTANASGTIDSVECQCNAAAIGNIVKGGILTESPNNYLTPRDTEQLGGAMAGYNLWTGLSIDVETGDVIGFVCTNSKSVKLERNSSGGTEKWYKPGDFPTATYTNSSSQKLALYGTGTEGGQDVFGAATLSGTGTLAGIGRVTCKGAATLSGEGGLGAAGSYLREGAATLSGTGSLAASGSKILSGIAAFAGAGALIVNGVSALAGKATLAGAGLLAAVGTIEGGIKYGAATLLGSGALVAAGVSVLVGAVTMAGTGALAAAAVKTLSGAATLSGIGLLLAVGGLLGDVCGSVILVGQGSISVIAESWHILTGQEYQDLLEGQIEFQEI
jgi:hypothetical protein